MFSSYKNNFYYKMILKILGKSFCNVAQRRFQTLVSTSWLAERISQGDNTIRILQASWAKCEDYNYGHIPGALCFNGVACLDTESPYKNILPTAEVFQKYASEYLGVSNDTHVIVYDDSQKLPSLDQGARVWFTFRVFGHDKVSLLNGGLYKWTEEKRQLETTTPQVKKGNFVAKFRPELQSYFDDVLENIKTKEFQLIDARVPGRYFGIGLEPYGKAGHIPNAVNIPVASLIDPDTKLVHEKSDLEKVFKKAKIDLNKPITTSCGSGIHACATIFAADLLGKKDTKLYNGSWFEWNRRAGDDLIIK